jgi:peptide/nickel transport system substrate-binding protein
LSKKRTFSLRLTALAAAVALVVAACGGDDDDSASESTARRNVEGRDGGTLIWAHEQEPVDMHLDDPNNNLSITSWIIQGLWEGLFGITAETQFFPELLTDDPQTTENDDGSVTLAFTLRDGLTWSDGEPLTSDDVKFTYDVIMERGTTDEDGDGENDFVYLIGDRTGYDTITNFEVTSPTEFSITWSAFFSGYKSIFERVFPKHAFGANAGAAEVNAALPNWKSADGKVLPSSGPLVFDKWDKGVSMTLVRNDRYHGSVSPDAENKGKAHIDGVRINWVADTDAQINALKSGEAQMIWTQPQVEFGDNIVTDDRFVNATRPGPSFEHWGFNLLNPHLKKPEVREAIALAIDKQEIYETLYEPLYKDLMPVEGLGNTYWMTNQEQYENHQADYGKGDADAAKQKLEDAGYTEGSGGIYEHPDDGPLTLRVGTTGGNKLRELQEQVIQQQLEKAGIRIEFDNVEGSDYFSERPFSEEALAAAASGGAEGDPTIWDITQFAWTGGPWPGGQSAAYRTGSGNNAYGYTNPEFDAKDDECNAETDDAALADCYNELDKYVTTLELDPENGLFMVPLTQKPQFYSYNGEVLSSAPVSPDADDAGPMVNAVDYQFAK